MLKQDFPEFEVFGVLVCTYYKILNIFTSNCADVINALLAVNECNLIYVNIITYIITIKC